MNLNSLRSDTNSFLSLNKPEPKLSDGIEKNKKADSED
jgi:hypothetical protein